MKGINFLIKLFNAIIISCLTQLRKIRGFDSQFIIFSPFTRNKRNWALWKIKVCLPLFDLDINLKRRVSSNIPLDVFIPISSKDFSSLKRVIDSVKKHIKHPINSIYIVSANDDPILAFCQNEGLIFIDENRMLGYNKSRIDYKHENEDRSGWLFQQLLKLNSDTICQTENILILDADTSFVRPRVFLKNNKFIIDQSEERHEPYHDVYEKILRRKTTSPLSFITHYMVFNKSILTELKQKIEKIHNCKWDEVIIKYNDYSSGSGFSEYELYGNFIYEHYHKNVSLAYWFNINVNADIYPNYIKSISLHSYLKNKLA